MAEINKRVDNNERVLIITLTKRMSEDLTDYLTNYHLRVRYLHSEIDSIKRISILRDLRLGEFDVSLTCSNSTGSDIEIKLEYITVVEPPSENSFTDVRDGKIYEYVEIGTQTWMAENLSYNHPLSKVSGNIPSREAIYGRLYDWETAKTVCPDGWHLPNHVEWFQFMNFTSWSATGIKEEGTEHWANPNDGDNYYGFTALGGGKHSSASSSQDFKTHAYFWCSDLYNPTQDGEIYILKHDEPSVSYDYAYSSVHGSVRCIKN